MSIQKMTWVWSSSPYKDAALLIHLALADHSNDEGICWPSRGSLARKARCSERTVSRAISKMAEDGYLEILNPGDGRGGQPRYRLTKPPQETETDCPGTPETETPVTQTGTSATNAPYTEPSKEPSSPPNPPEGGDVEPWSASFDVFWEQYPRKIGKPVARRAYTGACKKARPTEIVVGLDRWRAYWRERNEPEFIPHPSTWLNQERWNDTPPPTRAQQATTMDLLRQMASSDDEQKAIGQ